MNFKQLQWLFYEKRYRIRDYYLNRILSRHVTMPFFGKEPHLYLYGGKLLHSAKWTNDRIAELINGDEPFMVSRFGNTELNVMYASIKSKLIGVDCFNEPQALEWWDLLYSGAGFFPKDESLRDRFSEVMYESMKEADILGVWNRPMEDYHLRTSMKKTQITALRWLEPWYSNRPWTHALKGKKVLVIHPFEASIREQYAIRDKIFKDGLLPNFDLDVLRAVQTIGDSNGYGFATWFDALDYMYEEAMKRDFDVAIIGCGAYGMPLAARLKKAGKKAIHLGGVTQCIFGIKGSRWVNSPIDKIIPMNDYWIYPKDEETPKGAGNVENGCYWKG